MFSQETPELDGGRGGARAKHNNRCNVFTQTRMSRSNHSKKSIAAVLAGSARLPPVRSGVNTVTFSPWE